MSTDSEAPIRGLQLPLPLVDGEEDGDRVADRDSDREWHLDEHTRRIGIQGIAAARARLRAGSGRAA